MPTALRPGGMGRSRWVQSCSEWQNMQPETLLARYSPRAARSGVRSNVLVVTERLRGPRKGRQPIVKVIPMTSTAITITNTRPQIAAARAMLDFPPKCYLLKRLPFCNRPFQFAVFKPPY